MLTPVDAQVQALLDQFDASPQKAQAALYALPELADLVTLIVNVIKQARTYPSCISAEWDDVYEEVKLKVRCEYQHWPPNYLRQGSNARELEWWLDRLDRDHIPLGVPERGDSVDGVELWSLGLDVYSLGLDMPDRVKINSLIPAEFVKKPGRREFAQKKPWDEPNRK